MQGKVAVCSEVCTENVSNSCGQKAVFVDINKYTAGFKRLNRRFKILFPDMRTNLDLISLVSLVEIKHLVKYLAQGNISLHINSEEFSAAFFH